MSAAAGKKSTTSLSLFSEAFNLEAEGRSLHSGHAVLGRRSMDGDNGIRSKEKLG